MNAPFCPYIRDADFAERRPWKVGERRLLDFLLVLLQQGECVWTLDGQEFRPQIGQFCLVRPGQLVVLEGRTASVTPYAHFDLTFNHRREESFATRPGMLDLHPYRALLQPELPVLSCVPSLFFAPDGDAARKRFFDLIARWNQGSELARMEANAQLGTLMLEFARNFAELEGRALPFNKPFSWIESWLSPRLGDNVTVEDMAARARLSPSRFQARFKDEFATTPARYLLELRIKHAGELLLTTDWTLARIALVCGFADVHGFAKAFKRLQGRTPGEFRRGPVPKPK